MREIMIKVEIEKVVSDLNELFDVDNNLGHGTYSSENKFGISKQQLGRHEVIHKLQKYFSDKVIIDGYLSVGSITFIHTTFEVFEGKPPQN